MKKGRIVGLLLSLVLIGSFSLSLVVYAAGSNSSPKLDKKKPVPATDVKLVKKVTLKMRGPPFVPPGHDKKKNNGGGEAATGILGDDVSGDRYAIIVGISDYPDEDNDLQYCDDDALEMSQTLDTVYYIPSKNIITLIDKDATRSNIIEAIDALMLGVNPEDEVVFFFSGHGMKGRAADGDKEKVDEAIVAHDGTNLVPIWDGELKAAFLGFATSRLVFVFDTCLAGGMKRDLEAPGRVVVMATTENGYSYESEDWENGEFSYYFVDWGMFQGMANAHDYDNDGYIGQIGQVTVEEAFDYAKANCDYDKPTLGDYFENDLLP